MPVLCWHFTYCNSNLVLIYVIVNAVEYRRGLCARSCYGARFKTAPSFFRYDVTFSHNVQHVLHLCPLFSLE